MKTLFSTSSHWNSFGRCAHCKCTGKEFYKKNNKANDLDKKCSCVAIAWTESRLTWKPVICPSERTSHFALLRASIVFFFSNLILHLMMLICSRRHCDLSTSIAECLHHDKNSCDNRTLTTGFSPFVTPHSVWEDLMMLNVDQDSRSP